MSGGAPSPGGGGGSSNSPATSIAITAGGGAGGSGNASVVNTPRGSTTNYIDLRNASTIVGAKPLGKRLGAITLVKKTDSPEGSVGHQQQQQQQ